MGHLATKRHHTVMTGTDPVTGVKHGTGKVVLVDVRTPPEYQFQGTAGKVDNILLKGVASPVVPDRGKAKFTQDGRFLEYTLGGEKRRTPVDEIAELVTSSIAVHIPCATWDEVTKEMDPAPEGFAKGIEKLAEDGVQVVITMCNSGGRSTACVAKFLSEALASRFKAFYEIDRPGDAYVNPQHGIHLAGLGGYQGSAYGGVYNGSAGFPGRPTAKQPVQGWKQGAPRGPSVSWRDSGLPIFIPETSCNLPDISPTP
ncbi:MAG: hypothetical protein ABFS46_15670 [Myxococcota bacterium]